MIVSSANWSILSIISKRKQIFLLLLINETLVKSVADNINQNYIITNENNIRKTQYVIKTYI